MTVCELIDLCENEIYESKNNDIEYFSSNDVKRDELPIKINSNERVISLYDESFSDIPEIL